MAEVAWLSRLLLGIVFLLSGVFKLFEWRRFQDTFAALEVLPRWLVRPIGGLLPPLECILGICLVTEAWVVVSGRAALALLICFSLTLAVYRWRGGKELACGCFADFEHKTVTTSLIARNLLLLVAGLPVLLGQNMLTHHRLEDRAMASAVVLGVLLVWNMMRSLADTLMLIRSERLAEGS